MTWRYSPGPRTRSFTPAAEADRIRRASAEQSRAYAAVVAADEARQRAFREARARQRKDAELSELLEKSLEIAKGRNGVSVQKGDEAKGAA